LSPPSQRIVKSPPRVDTRTREIGQLHGSILTAKGGNSAKESRKQALTLRVSHPLRKRRFP
jgi:hypothetical protein